MPFSAFKLTVLSLAAVALVAAEPTGEKQCCGPFCAGCCVREGDFCLTKLLNVSTGRLLPNIGGRGGGGHCQPWKSGKECNSLPEQLTNPIDFDVDPSFTYLYVADQGYDVSAPLGRSNSSRIMRYNLKDPNQKPVVISHCGQFVRVKYDASRNQLLALRITQWPVQGGGRTTGGTEILRFDPMEEEPAGTVCHAKFDTNPTLKNRVIGRKGLMKTLHPARTMFLLGNSETVRNSVLVGDQEQNCVLAYPLNGSFGSNVHGIPVAGTCGKGSDVGVPVDTDGKAGKVLSQSPYGLVYGMFPSASDGARKAGDLPTTVSLHDMNHGTIDMGGSPEASHNFPMVPIQSFSSSLYGVPLWDRRKSQNKPELITVDLFGKRAATRSAKGNGLKPDGFDGGKGETLFDISSWGAFYADEHNQTQPIQGLPMHWVWTPEGKLLALMSYTYSTFGVVDSAFVEFDVPLPKH
jgi:hypothetical protein